MKHLLSCGVRVSNCCYSPDKICHLTCSVKTTNLSPTFIQWLPLQKGSFVLELMQMTEVSSLARSIFFVLVWVFSKVKVRQAISKFFLCELLWLWLKSQLWKGKSVGNTHISKQFCFRHFPGQLENGQCLVTWPLLLPKMLTMKNASPQGTNS